MKKLIALSFTTVIMALTSCSNDDAGDNGQDTAIANAKTAFVDNYVTIVKASYDDALAQTQNLKTAIDAFVSAPDATNFNAAKQAWLDAREPYGQTEAYRFYDGPIDGDGGEPEGYINAWPLDEALIDYVADGTGGQQGSDTRQNIINNTTEYPTLSKTVLLDIIGYNQNESNVTLGYHAIEFLLWGQDSSAPGDRIAGQRAYTDYTTADNADRRGQYLKLAAEILVEDLKSVVDQWKEGAAYRKEFLALSKNDAIDKLLTGAAKLSKGELAGERMTVAVENQDQEDEHSCFSDNTHRDVFLNAKSINNIITGKYTRVDGSVVSGTSLLDVLKLINAEESATLAATTTLVMAKVQVISDAKFFDYQIIGETIDNISKPVMSTVSSLEKQGDELAQAGKTITGKNIDPSV
ncbi:putative iron-regulated protein [Tenacibaculum sp. MAR_2009_124]|uniref:imelysin family protein n=1 Tax=Tenacibaculum sp. MAR_2009_124 TaxID=1250059 RepID=UPI000895DB38|nr:imelysin family protein [Tenacibaculum sp. MAR_2009_124]SEB50086.1 putative iron-regulated protein [Tenacibaculum sp. MAR_2009_124]